MDDEESSSRFLDDSNGAASSSHARTPRWDDEDTTPVSSRELYGWFSYGLAAEVYAVVGLGSFLPVTIEQLAREVGVKYFDKTTPCTAPDQPPPPPPPGGPGGPGGRDVVAAVLRFLMTRQDGGGGGPPPPPPPQHSIKDNQCLIRPFGHEVTTASFAMYTFSVAVFVQALFLVSFSATADHGDNRKRLLLSFGFTGGITCMLFLFIGPRTYLFGALLVVIGVTCLGSSFVILNSFLPLLAFNHPELRKMESAKEMAADDLPPTPTTPTGSSASMKHTQISPELQLSTRISSKGVGIGYAAAVCVQILSILLLFLMNKFYVGGNKSLSLRLVLFLVGSWWMLFTIPAALWLRKRPGRPLLTSASKTANMFQRAFSYFIFSWRSLFRTVYTAVSLPQIRLFLLAWFLLSDATATIAATAILFARTELNMSTIAIAFLSITVTTSGIIGATAWPHISRRLRWSPNRTIVACIILMCAVPIYGLLYYIPFIRNWGVGGIQQWWEIYPMAVIHGLVMGGLSSYCRSFFGQMIPPGREAAFYALFAITDKGSSAVGPAVVGRIVDATGSIRPAFFFLAGLLFIPIPMMYYVNAEKGRKDALRMAVGEGGLKPEAIAAVTAEDFELQAGEAERLMRGDREHDDDDDDDH